MKGEQMSLAHEFVDVLQPTKKIYIPRMYMNI